MNASKFATRMNASKLGVLAVLTLVLATSLSAAPVAAADGEIRALNPSHLEHGDSAQTISIVGTAPGELTVLTIDVTPLAAAGVDLSNATLSVDRDPNDLLSNARIERTDDAVLLRVRIAARANDTDFRARLRLDNIDTSDADHTDLRYDADFGDQSLHSHWFELSDPRIPELSEVSEPEWLVAGQENASQETRLIMFSLPSNTSLTVTVDLSNLTEAGVALTDVEATATISDQGATVKSVQRSGSTVEIGVDVTTA